LLKAASYRERQASSLLASNGDGTSQPLKTEAFDAHMGKGPTQTHSNDSLIHSNYEFRDKQININRLFLYLLEKNPKLNSGKLLKNGLRRA
jgi:hypothetical protein